MVNSVNTIYPTSIFFAKISPFIYIVLSCVSSSRIGNFRDSRTHRLTDKHLAYMEYKDVDKGILGILGI